MKKRLMFLAAMLAMVPVAPPPCWHSRRTPLLLSVSLRASNNNWRLVHTLPVSSW